MEGISRASISWAWSPSMIQSDQTAEPRSPWLGRCLRFGDEEVGVGEIEAVIEAEGHDGGGGAGGAYAGEDAEDAGFGVETEIVVAGGEREDGVEVLTLDPVLVFAGEIAGVGALLEHVDDYDFDLDGVLRGGLAGGAEGRGEQEESVEAAHDSMVAYSASCGLRSRFRIISC